MEARARDDTVSDDDTVMLNAPPSTMSVTVQYANCDASFASPRDELSLMIAYELLWGFEVCENLREVGLKFFMVVKLAFLIKAVNL